MQVNIGKIMNLANKAGMPKVEKAYPSMALGTAEATPLQVATAYTMFANLGDRVLPMPITQVTGGDGRIIASPSPDKSNVLRPDVAYIMDDIMKDVINRGTAAQAQSWGFRNVPGKTAFAGKTGTSRDGWFAGFTPELVCVVYVGFDNGDDLGMKGSDSAMPIWADFMKAALAEHTDWNGDWAMPAMVRKAEIDIRNGSLIRELGGVTATEVSATPSPSPTVTPTPDPAWSDPAWATEQYPQEQPVENASVPPEFRRVELFVSGTVPNRLLLRPGDESFDENLALESSESPPTSPTPTPVSETWQEKIEPNKTPTAPGTPGDRQERVTVVICGESGMRATSRCPIRETRTYRKGSEPREFCQIH